MVLAAVFPYGSVYLLDCWQRYRVRRNTRTAARFRRLAISLGGLMIKVGQFLSARLDVLPPEIIAELAGLQDEVPPVAFAALRALAEAELGMPLERAYAWVDEQPVAAASLGQVHRARLHAAQAAGPGGVFPEEQGTGSGRHDDRYRGGSHDDERGKDRGVFGAGFASHRGGLQDFKGNRG